MEEEDTLPVNTTTFSSKQSGEEGVRVRVYFRMTPLDCNGWEYRMKAEWSPVLGTSRRGAPGTGDKGK